MRCLSVADALAGLGADVSFVLSDGNSVQLIESRGFATSVLGSDWRDIRDGADELCRLCNDAELPIVLVDTYSVSRAFVDCLAQHAKVCYLGSKDGDLGKLSLIINYSTCIDEAFYEDTYGDRGRSSFSVPNTHRLDHASPVHIVNAAPRLNTFS